VFGTSVLDVAKSLGMLCGPEPFPGWFEPCPSCGHTEAQDIGPERSRRRWRCLACGAEGTTLDLVALRLCGVPYGELDPTGTVKVQAWCKAFLASHPPVRRLHKRRRGRS
jgi:hypothetical protein